MGPQKLILPEVHKQKASLPILRQRFYRIAQILEGKTKFTRMEIEGLLRIFDKILEKYKSPMTKPVFKDVMFNFFDLTNDAMMERMFRTVSSVGSSISYEDWILTMNVFLRGSLLEEANFAFSVYDQQKRDILTKEDIQTYLKNVFIAQLADEDAEEMSTDMLDMVFVLLDRDKDGYISRKDFVKSVLSEPLLLQVLGQCLPAYKSICALESLISQRDEHFTRI